MKALTGSEKQVAWAEDIRSRYIKTAELLKESIAIYSDMSEDEYIVEDPVLGDHTEKKYTVTTSPKQDAAAWTAERHWGQSWQFNRADEIRASGDDHADRKARKEFLELLYGNLVTALEEEVNAKYWIDRK